MLPGQWNGFLAGFDLCGWRQPDGTIKCSAGGDKTLAEWPAEITTNSATYTLERVEQGQADPIKGVWENAIYV